jgi:hypothetical protein
VFQNREKAKEPEKEADAVNSSFLTRNENLNIHQVGK